MSGGRTRTVYRWPCWNQPSHAQRSPKLNSPSAGVNDDAGQKWQSNAISLLRIPLIFMADDARMSGTQINGCVPQVLNWTFNSLYAWATECSSIISTRTCCWRVVWCLGCWWLGRPPPVTRTTPWQTRPPNRASEATTNHRDIEPAGARPTAAAVSLRARAAPRWC